MAEVELALFRRGSSTPFSDWIAGLKDTRARAIVRARLNRIRLGNFGDCKPVGGGVEEVRIDFGPGYRVYYGRAGRAIVILLCAGQKKTQARDIVLAQKYWREYQDATTKNRH